MIFVAFVISLWPRPITFCGFRLGAKLRLVDSNGIAYKQVSSPAACGVVGDLAGQPGS